MKKISVICCLYNTKPELFRKTLLSIKNQTFEDFNVYIVNDGSIENLEENKQIILELNDNRFIFIDREHEGKSQTLNYAILNSFEKYICICDSDDVMYNNRLEYQYNFLEENQQYDYLSNAVLTSDKQVFPNSYDLSQELTLQNCGYLGNHNCCMFRRSIINKIPFLFQQYYDYIEDLVFNYLICSYGIKMYYDNTILQEYTFNLSQSSHKIGLQPYYKESSYKTQLNTFINNSNKGDITVLLICNNWKIELEKTILSIRTTSNQVNIVVFDISTDKFNYECIASKYFCNYYKFENCNICNVINNKLDYIENKNILFICEPCRFYEQNWDIYLMRFKNDFYNEDIIFPNICKIKKINDNFYDNEESFFYNEREYSSKLNLLSVDIEKKLNKYIVDNEYSTYENCCSIPKMIFFTSKKLLNSINGLLPFDYNYLLNLFLSLKSKLCGYKIILYKDFKVGYVDIQNKTNNKDLDYYKELYYFVNFFFNETIYIYENQIEKIIGTENLNLIKKELENNLGFKTYKKFFYYNSCNKNISDILKNV